MTAIRVGMLLLAMGLLSLSFSGHATESDKGSGYAILPASKSARDISVQAGEIEKRLEGIEKSVASVKGIEKSVKDLNVSLAQIAAALREENLRELESSAGDIVLARGALLILLATACGAGLIVLHAMLRRSFRQD